MSTIYLVRHGITPANKENRFAGRTSEELHPEGVEQVRQVGQRLCHNNIAAIYCGPAKRTVQSAEIIGAILNVPYAPIPELDEISIPHWDGLTKDEIRQHYGAQYPTWLATPQTFAVEGCETLQQVQDRAVQGLSRLYQDNNSANLLVVSHLIVLRCLVLYYQGLALNNFRSVTIDNGAILQVSGTPGDRMAVDYK